MVITARNDITKDDIKALVNCNGFKLKFMLILITAVFSAFLVFALIAGNKLGDLNVYILGVVWCAVVYVYAFIFNPKLKYNSFVKKFGADAIIKYEFKEKNFCITINGKKGEFQKYKDYFEMYRIYETPEYYFFYLKSSESYILKKRELTSETAKELSEMIYKENPRIFVQRTK